MNHFGTLASDMSRFREGQQIGTIGVFAAIFTWGMIQALKSTLLTPLLEAYVIPHNTAGWDVKLRGGRVLRVSTFLAELIQWLVFMTALFAIWRYTHREGAGASSGASI